ncbi:hypothetical protein QVD17_33638 [Tagetes erecta]|uniref:F-box domain-containing protein n=1 Tax=Tagetes erecta TaxID=13708 RepID=A0AAD8JYY1_TARER|nr:hypothetical protein QVD17_33638 [Tagetes erecta]
MIMKKTAKFYGLSNEIWRFIFTLLVTSDSGATDLACLSATCRKFHKLSRNPKVLKAVSFEEFDIDEYIEHHHVKDLLCLCARAGNPAAESMLGKALLCNDAFFWGIILEYDLPRIAPHALLSGQLRFQGLVRRYIRDAADEDIAVMRVPLFTYMVFVLGFDMAEYCGMFLAVANMCSFYLEEGFNVEHGIPMAPLRGLYMALPQLTPPSGEAHRARVLEIYDEMIPLPSPK